MLVILILTASGGFTPGNTDNNSSDNDGEVIDNCDNNENENDTIEVPDVESLDVEYDEIYFKDCEVYYENTSICGGDFFVNEYLRKIIKYTEAQL